MPRSSRTVVPIAFTSVLLYVGLVGCAHVPRSASSAKSPVAQLEAELPKHAAFGYALRDVVSLRDLRTTHIYRLYVLQGGPTYDQDGGVGLFDEDDRLIDWMRIEGIEGLIEGTGRIREASSVPDSLILRTLLRSGTGLHDDSLLVLTVIDGKLVETFRGPGNLVETFPGGIEQRVTRLAFADLGEDGINELISMTYVLRDSVPQTTSAVYLYEPGKKRFLLQNASHSQ